MGRWDYRHGLTKDLLGIALRNRERARGKNPKLVGRLLWFFASRLRSCLPVEQKSEEDWTMKWMEASSPWTPEICRKRDRGLCCMLGNYNCRHIWPQSFHMSLSTKLLCVTLCRTSPGIPWEEHPSIQYSTILSHRERAGMGFPTFPATTSGPGVNMQVSRIFCLDQDAGIML